MKPRLIDVPRARLDEAADVLGEAFLDYAVFRFVLPAGTADRERKLRAIMRYYVFKRLSRGWPVLAVEQEGRLQAVLALNPPEPMVEPVELIAEQESMVAIIGDEAESRRLAYEHQSDLAEPTLPHFFVGMIGARRSARGRGHGTKLLHTVHGMSATHPLSQGVALTTENEANLAMYQRMGYRVTSETSVGSIHSWAMWRPDDSC